MVSNKERGNKIRLQILRDVKHHPRDLVKHIASIFSITPQAVFYHVKTLENENRLRSEGRGRGKVYFLGDIRTHISLFEFSDKPTEDRIWREHFSYMLEGIDENVDEICHYGFTEMVNNAIDHSEGDTVFIQMDRTKDNISVAIIDDGEGIFRKISRVCELADETQAILELSKGKLTTDPDNHSGEGIFFTSRAFDTFEINSKGLKFSHDVNLNFDYLFDADIFKGDWGTLIQMNIRRDSSRSLREVFDRFTSGPDDFNFNKTVIPVRLASYDNEKLVSRSQAKRLLLRVERFQNVVFDFKDVPSIGQAFADEIFRVYASKHPDIILLPVNMDEPVEFMVNRALGHGKN